MPRHRRGGFSRGDAVFDLPNKIHASFAFIFISLPISDMSTCRSTKTHLTPWGEFILLSLLRRTHGLSWRYYNVVIPKLGRLTDLTQRPESHNSHTSVVTYTARPAPFLLTPVGVKRREVQLRCSVCCSGSGARLAACRPPL